MDIVVDDPTSAHVRTLLREHLDDMYATSPADSVHALDKELGHSEGEIKSMRTTDAARGRGVASAILERILLHATSRNFSALRLETGPQDFFLPARRLYARHGFVECGPFADYTLDPYSVFMSRDLVSDPYVPSPRPVS
jgi:putative acetyltransferase